MKSKKAVGLLRIERLGGRRAAALLSIGISFSVAHLAAAGEDQSSTRAPLNGVERTQTGAPQRPLAGAHPLAFRVAKIVSMDDRDSVLNDAVVLVKDGKIESVGRSSDTKIPDGYEVKDFSECWIVPGLVDCHDHVAGSQADLNDMVYLTNPGLNNRAAITPNNDNVRRARCGGVTSMMFIPGSGTNMGGFGTIAKSGGDTPEQVIVRSPGSLKIAQAGNPEWYFGGNN